MDIPKEAYHIFRSASSNLFTCERINVEGVEFWSSSSWAYLLEGELSRRRGPLTSLSCLFPRKVNLREMKILQREEQKQGILLMAKIRRQWDAQEQRFEQELQVPYK